MFQWTKKDDLSALLLDSSTAEHQRAERVWRFVIVLGLTWLFFTCFLWVRGYAPATAVCLIASSLYLILFLTCHNHGNYRRIMNLNLTISAFGLFFVAASDPALATTMLFYPVSILVASQLLGVRAAFSWFIINVFAFGLFFLTVYGIRDFLDTWRFDEFALILGVAACVFFCCQQGEEYYRERTKNLIGVSQRLREKSEYLQELATTDALTGLMNRFCFQQKLKEKVEFATKHSKGMALFLIDMDGFKEINDTMGHPVGDAALVEIGIRLSKYFSKVADVARLGGDEFCLIHPSIENHEQAEAVAREICDRLTLRYHLEEADFPLGVSIGYALSPLDSSSDRDLLAYADTAMFHAKENRLGFACYESEMTERLVEYRSIQEKLSLALEREEFHLLYQPQVNLQSGKVIGVEALLRWRHDGETIPPFRFIHLLEKNGEIVPVSKWIIRESCRQLAAWTAAGYDVEISINVSAVQFNDPDFYRSITEPIEEFGVDARMLDFEITEGLLIDDVEQAVAKLKQIKETGASISIDDFGTGYSSLAYLRQFPLDRLKIDRAFIKDIPDSDDGVIASSIIVLAKSLGLKVLAEGVETDEHLNFLLNHDCDEYQGYYRSRPVGPDEVVALFTPVDQGHLTEVASSV